MSKTRNKNRKDIRYVKHDYASPSIYFITVCIDSHREHFGAMTNKTMQLNSYGEIARDQWLWLKHQYPYIQLDEFIIMPNHLHGILIVNYPNRGQPIAPLTEMIGAFKSTTSKFIHRAGLIDFAWQRTFYDRIIRDPIELEHVCTYIKNNPMRWKHDTIRRGGS